MAYAMLLGFRGQEKKGLQVKIMISRVAWGFMDILSTSRTSADPTWFVFSEFKTLSRLLIVDGYCNIPVSPQSVWLPTFQWYKQ